MGNPLLLARGKGYIVMMSLVRCAAFTVCVTMASKALRLIGEFNTSHTCSCINKVKVALGSSYHTLCITYLAHTHNGTHYACSCKHMQILELT